MKNNRFQSNKIDRRTLLLMSLQAGMFSVLGSRLFFLQSIEKETYTILSHRNFLRVIFIPPSRGVITDSNGVKLSYNKRIFRVHIVKQDMKQILTTLKILKSIIDLSDEDISRTIKRAKYRHSYTGILVKENLNWEEISRISVQKVYLKGVEVSAGESRFYPMKKYFCHTVGYVGKVLKKEVKNDHDPLLTLPGFEIGKQGAEKYYEEHLRGKAGTQQVEVNVKGIPIRTLEGERPVGGESLALTIDSRLQVYAMELLKPHKSASIVVMDIKTGAIKAMASQPSFDPNLFVGGISYKDWNTIVNNKYSPLVNKSIQGQYAPGSTFKMIVALSALSVNINPKHKIYCNGFTEILGRKFHCWKKQGHGNVNLNKSLRESCDIWYYKTSLKVGIKNIAKTARIFGLGQTYDLGLNSQKSGLIPDRQWKKKRYNKSWLIGETIISSIGQGYVLTTPLQLAVMTARIASGKEVSPFVSMIDKNNLEQPKTLNISDEHLDMVRWGMFEVVNHYRGTAKRSKPNQWVMAGKTGTTQVRSISQNERDSETGIIKNQNLEWKYRDHASFVGFAPVHDPQYAVSCVVEHGGSGSSIAGPLVRDMFNKITSLYDPLAIPILPKKKGTFKI